MNIEQWWYDTDSRKPKYLGKDLSQCKFVHYKSHMNWFWIIKHSIIQLMHNILYVDTIKIIKYLKVLHHVSDHTGSIIREPCTVLG